MRSATTRRAAGPMDDRVTGQPTDLPVEVTNLVGRRREITHLLRLLKTLRLVTMTGVGGSGKTRLALRVAERSRRNFARTGWVDLSGLTDDSLLEYQIAEALGIRDQSDRSVSEIVLAYLRERDLLLVLDNCEHLLDACATFVDRALPAAGGLRVLCTSRQPLGLIGEHIFTVLPLPVPDPDQPLHAVSGARYPGVALFVERAAAAAPGFTMTPRNRARIVELCRRLDGLPLAIELAAAQVHRLSVDAIDAELSDQFAGSSGEEPLGRHKALAATFDWSFELCTPAEQVLWARLSVFAGVFELAAAEHVCAGAQLAAEDIWEPLAGLVDKSVLIRDDNAGEARYRLLDTVRQYGLDRLRGVGGLNGVGEAGLRRRHRDWYLDLAERFHAGWFGPDQPAWNRRISAELANLRGRAGERGPAARARGVRLAAQHPGRARRRRGRRPRVSGPGQGAGRSAARRAFGRRPRLRPVPQR
ncbi:MAG: hypothetical protein AUI14_21735 [Actinobacteria bacterium 13_2_20CM_2_71_6]|nr:MAG: hypothetical protein AUI14_21735 [Actinobacteria bacterium 13_2_20CM_2_71_6]